MALQIKLVGCAGDGHTGGLRDQFKLLQTGLTLYDYDLYAVEHWVVDRARPISTILVSSTSDVTKTVLVDVYVPKTEDPQNATDLWETVLANARLEGLKPKQTHLGFVLATPLLSFAPRYEIVHIPGGDFEKAKDALFTNINVRQMKIAGRTALTLAEPGNVQMERFLNLYRLQLTTSPQAFQIAMLSLIKLVQVALSMFNMGPLCLSPALGTLREPDGLLCESTIDGLQQWRIDIAEPLMGMVESADNPLQASVLAALLSLVISIRSRLLLLGILVTLDPFEDRLAFLRAFDGYIRTTRGAPSESRFLTVANIQHLRQQSTRTPKSQVKRFFNHGLEEFHIKGESATQAKGGIMDQETMDIAVFEAALKAYSGGNDVASVVNLWKGNYKPEKMIGRSKLSSSERVAHVSPVVVTAPHEDGQHSAIHHYTDTEDESGLGTKLIRGVTKTTRKLGDGVSGFLDKAVVWPGQDTDAQQDAARLRHSQPLIGQTSHEGAASHALTMSEPASGSRFSPFHSLLNLSRPASAAGMAARQDSNADADTLAEDAMLLAPTRAPDMRRAASDMGTGAPAMQKTSSQISISNKVLEEKRWRRYSFGCERDPPAKNHLMAPRRLKMDVDLHMRSYELRKRELQLQKLARALTAIDTAYAQALAQVLPITANRQKKIDSLAKDTKSLSEGVDAFNPPEDDDYRGKLVSSAASWETVDAVKMKSKSTEHNGPDLERAATALRAGRTRMLDRVGDGDKFSESEYRARYRGSAVNDLGRLIKERKEDWPTRTFVYRTRPTTLALPSIVAALLYWITIGWIQSLLAKIVRR